MKIFELFRINCVDFPYRYLFSFQFSNDIDGPYPEHLESKRDSRIVNAAHKGEPDFKPGLQPPIIEEVVNNKVTDPPPTEQPPVKRKDFPQSHLDPSADHFRLRTVNGDKLFMYSAFYDERKSPPIVKVNIIAPFKWKGRANKVV